MIRFYWLCLCCWLLHTDRFLYLGTMTCEECITKMVDAALGK